MVTGPDEVAPAWFTVMFLVILPPETVTVPVRDVLPVFAVTVTATLPLFEPLPGLTLIQLWLSVAVQLTLEVTVRLLVPAPAPTFKIGGLTDKLLLPPVPMVM